MVSIVLSGSFERAYFQNNWFIISIQLVLTYAMQEKNLTTKSSCQTVQSHFNVFEKIQKRKTL